MPIPIHDRLLHAKERLRQKQKLEAMLQEAQSIRDQERRKCERHEQVLAGEKADVENLEGISLTGLFYTILGTKEERLETERQEYLSAKLKQEECTQALDDVRQDVARLQSELGGYRDAELEYNRLLEKKRHLLAESSNQSAETLMTLSEQLVELQEDCRELREAITAGETAQLSLEQVLSQLGSAANWGTWDLLGGDTLATWVKHSKIDSAKRQAQVAQRHLRRFQEELADADQRLHVSLGEIGGFSTFADFFFDGLIADWVVQSKIQNASKACSSTIETVKAAVSECHRRLAETEQGVKRVTEERQRFIEEA